MPLAGKGMLLTSMDIDPSDEAEFNRWYDREHLEERVAIDGFLEARRYVAHEGQSEISLPVLHRDFRGARQPGLSHRACQPDRLVEDEHRAFQKHDPRGRAHHDQPRTGPRCGARHRPPAPSAGGEDKLRAALREQLDPENSDGIISMHLIESDPALSRPITDDPSAPNPGAGDWFVLIDGTDVNAVSAAIAARLAPMPRFKSRRDLDRHLRSDVGPGEERHSDV